MVASPEDPCQLWTGTPDAFLSLELIHTTLARVDDDLWVAAACVDRLVDDVKVQRQILEEGLKRSSPSLDRVRNISHFEPTYGDEASSSSGQTWKPDETLVSYFQDEPADAQMCHIRSILLDRLDRLNTFVEICQTHTRTETEESADNEWEDDPWDDGEADKEQAVNTPPFPLSKFLSGSMTSYACLLATMQSFSSLLVLLMRHNSVLWPSRLVILDSIPEHSSPSDYRELLPALQPSTDLEQVLPTEPWREQPDWSELPVVQESLKASAPSSVLPYPTPPFRFSSPLSSHELTSWYIGRVERTLLSTGMADVALALVQHGASQGIAGLDELGEELSLLSRLVYRMQVPNMMDEDWSLERWKTMKPAEVVQAYLQPSTPETVVSGIRKLVIPYLFVLESRAERAGTPDPLLSTRLLQNYILTAPLEMVAPIFEASKPTLPAAQRLIRDDEDIARLALACLYGCDSLVEWPTMSRIFECLPVWDLAGDDNLADEGDTTVSSLGLFVTPTTATARCTPSDLFLFFQPLPPSSLSRILDILDVHLESGEILARWNVAAPLRWFLQSANDEGQQRSRATRMSRRHGGSEDNLDSQDEWEWLLEDMRKLAGTNEAGLKSAFGLLNKAEVIRIFFTGLLSTGKFNVAKSLLLSQKSPLHLDDAVIEDICLASSREFYDNSSSANYRFGDMKLAYDCLSVPAESDAITREKEFIEATSRIASFNVMSRPGIPIAPIEIRLTKDRLTLVSRVLSSNSDAYKYTEVILDLVHKLGFRDDPVAKVKALAMIADTALQAEDFSRAYETNEMMVEIVLQLKASSIAEDKVQEASEVCWVACFQLGRQPEFNDVHKKLILLGRALEFCSSDKLVDVLSAWCRLEEEDIKHRKERLAKKRTGGTRDSRFERTVGASDGALPSLATRFQNLQIPSIPSSPDAAALANTFSRVAANFPFSVGGGRPRSVASDDTAATRSRSNDRPRTKPDHEDVSAQASRAFQKGIGWLIGADEE